MNRILKIYIIILFLQLVMPFFVLAEAKWAMPDPKITIPGMANLKEMKPVCTPPDNDGKEICTMPWLSEYIAGIYKYAIGVVAILATLVMMIGGIVWLTAGGDSGKIGTAKQYINGSLVGMVLVFSSYTILYWVNPDLVKLKPIKVEKIKAVKTEEMKNLCSWKLKDYEQLINRCPKGSTQSTQAEKDCGTNPYGSTHICCCPELGGDWKYDPGIEKQITDASFSLTILLNCLRSNMPTGVGRISSISDKVGITPCIGDLYSNITCSHSKDSCHYGGTTNEATSYAVDLGDEENKDAIYSAIEACSENVQGYLYEGNHIHISAKGCRGD